MIWENITIGFKYLEKINIYDFFQFIQIMENQLEMVLNGLLCKILIF